MEIHIYLRDILKEFKIEKNFVFNIKFSIRFSPKDAFKGKNLISFIRAIEPEIEIEVKHKH
jgi:hypothetical protein